MKDEATISPTLVYQDEMLRIYWNGIHKYYLSDWQHVFRKGEELRRAYQACIDAARARPGALWLIDSSKFPVIDLADAQWIESHFWPEFIRAGATHAAVVTPEKAIGKLSASRSAKKAVEEGGFSVTMHTTRAQAEAALLEWRAKQRDR